MGGGLGRRWGPHGAPVWCKRFGHPCQYQEPCCHVTFAPKSATQPDQAEPVLKHSLIPGEPISGVKSELPIALEAQAAAFQWPTISWPRAMIVASLKTDDVFVRFEGLRISIRDCRRLFAYSPEGGSLAKFGELGSSREVGHALHLLRSSLLSRPQQSKKMAAHRPYPACERGSSGLLCSVTRS